MPKNVLLLTWYILYKFTNSEITCVKALGSLPFHLSRLGTSFAIESTSRELIKLSSSKRKSGANHGAEWSKIISHFNFLEQYGRTKRNWLHGSWGEVDGLSTSTFALQRP